MDRTPNTTSSPSLPNAPRALPLAQNNGDGPRSLFETPEGRRVQQRLNFDDIIVNNDNNNITIN